ncbi:MAG: ABC transporter ATP-binding protein, partial [Ktedonobacteraceae bacterium]
RYRSQVVGHVWQQSGRNLLPDLSIAENVDLPQIFNGVSAGRYKRRTRELLEIVGLAAMARKKSTQLSGGEQQRAAIAVALANQPPLLLADEPTGELDSLTTQQIITFLRQINANLGVTIIIVTHDIAVATLVDRTLAIRDGRTSTETILREQVLPFAATGPSAVIGLPAETHQELIFIDRVGLLQLPQQAMEHVSLRGRVDLHVASDHVELWPAGMGDAIYSNLHTTGGSAVIGLSARSHHEVVLVDRVCRLQLPPEALANIPFHGRARVRIARSHVELWP